MKQTTNIRMSYDQTKLIDNLIEELKSKLIDTRPVLGIAVKCECGKRCEIVTSAKYSGEYEDHDYVIIIKPHDCEKGRE